MNRKVRASIVSAVFMAAGFLIHDESAGQTYPNKPIRVIVPFSPGGGADLMGRLVAQKLTESLKQQAIVDNRAGAAGRVGTEHVARASPDGYTLLLATSSVMITAPALYSNLPYDVQRDFTPITLLASGAYVLVVHPSVPTKTVRELIALAKARPGDLNYASSGPGGPAHLSGELFQAMANVKMVHVPYKGSGPGTMAAMAGETDLMFSNVLPALPAIRSKRLRPLAITSTKRSSLLPDVPTVAEAGLPGFNVETLYGMVAPAGTPRSVVERLNTALVKGMSSPEVHERIRSGGSEVVTSTPEEFGKVIKVETAKWTKVIKDAGIKHR